MGTNADRHLLLCKAIGFVLIAATLAGCTDQPLDSGDGDFHPIPTILVQSLHTDPWPNAPYHVSDAQVVGNTLLLDVTYGGGCREHVFQFVVSTTFLESNPVQAPSLLAHDDNDDACDALLRGRFRTNLSALRVTWQQAYQAQSGAILLGWRTPDSTLHFIRYEF
jgi:hypothetical protein